MDHRRIDPERPHTDRPFDRADGYSGQDYRPEDEAAIGLRDHARAQQADGRDIPPDNGRRAGFAQRTGEVRGAGVGAGGGQDGEDFDTASASGGTYPLTGSEGEASTPGDLGPAHFKD
jgi:hypothetical protein